jgi:hypothetical protein
MCMWLHLVLKKLTTSLFLSRLFNHAGTVRNIASLLMTVVLILSSMNKNSTSFPVHYACEPLHLTISHIHHLSNKKMENTVIFNPRNSVAMPDVT